MIEIDKEVKKDTEDSKKESIKAPVWFQKNLQESHSYRKRAELRLIKKGINMSDTEHENDEEILDEALGEVKAYIGYAGAIADLAWAKFRFENKENIFGRADELHYNKDKKLIEIKEEGESKHKEKLGFLQL